jgi:hypothetical protein
LRQIHCRFLSLGFEPHFFQTISLGDGVYPSLPADAGKPFPAKAAFDSLLADFFFAERASF